MQNGQLGKTMSDKVKLTCFTQLRNQTTPELIPIVTSPPFHFTSLPTSSLPFLRKLSLGVLPLLPYFLLCVSPIKLSRDRIPSTFTSNRKQVFVARVWIIGGKRVWMGKEERE